MALEICVDTIQSVRNAFKGGADRIELCSALSEGGLTPTVGFLRLTRFLTSPNFPIFSMIRPRGGNFVYDDEEILIMEHDIRVLKENGANGFVFGILTSDNNVDVPNCKRLLEVAKPLPVTFHRAFDEAGSPFEALATIIELGFDRLLTSGQAKTAEAGNTMISRLVTQSCGRIIVMPGAGINPNNLIQIQEVTRAREFHGSAKGNNAGDRSETSEAIVRDLKNFLKNLSL